MKTCLIVDDSRVVRKLARLILEDLGVSCRDAEDGRQAFDACIKAMPDAILLDWNMPVMTGLDFVRLLRTSPGGKAPKVIFCSTYNDKARIEEALGAGADDYIMKPFDADILAAKFQDAGIL